MNGSTPNWREFVLYEGLETLLYVAQLRPFWSEYCVCALLIQPLVFLSVDVNIPNGIRSVFYGLLMALCVATEYNHTVYSRLARRILCSMSLDLTTSFIRWARPSMLLAAHSDHFSSFSIFSATSLLTLDIARLYTWTFHLLWGVSRTEKHSRDSDPWGLWDKQPLDLR